MNVFVTYECTIVFSLLCKLYKYNHLWTQFYVNWQFFASLNFLLLLWKWNIFDNNAIYFFWFLNEIFFSLVLKCYFLHELYIFYRGGDNLSQKSHSSSGGGYQVMTNGHGHSGGVSPNSSQLSMDTGRPEQTLVSRTQKQHVTHNVRTKSKYF